MGKDKSKSSALKQLVSKPNRSAPDKPKASLPAQNQPVDKKQSTAVVAKGSKFEIIRLQFTAPLHLSDARPNDYGNSQRVLHSDAFTAAIYQAWAMLGKTEWIPEAIASDSDNDRGAQSPGFVLSSLFPFHGGKIADPKTDTPDVSPIYFLPKPYFLNTKEERSNNPAEAKTFKKVQYVDTAFFTAFLNQTTPPDDSTNAIKGAYRSQALANLSEEQAEFITTDVVPRIAKPRDESEPDPFYMERVYFRYDSGLWAIVQYDSETDRAGTKYRLNAALNYLAENGLGTDRAVGNGQFRWQWDSIRIETPADGQYAVNLSLFCPDDAESLTTMLDNDKARYDLIRRGGWLSEPHNTYRKRSVWMFREGGLMRLPDRLPTAAGRTVDLQPHILQKQHPVWRSGRSLFLPVNL